MNTCHIFRTLICIESGIEFNALEAKEMSQKIEPNVDLERQNNLYANYTYSKKTTNTKSSIKFNVLFIAELKGCQSSL